MATNPTVTQLDHPQIVQRTYDIANDAVRVSIGSAQFIVEGEGLSASGTMTSGSAGAVVASTACVGIKEFQMYAVATTATTGSITVRIDVSPTSPGVSFYQSSTTLTLGASSIGAINVSTILNDLIAQSVKVTITANTLAAAEVVTVYIVGNSF
jgi:hypothetical protein